MYIMYSKNLMQEFILHSDKNAAITKQPQYEIQRVLTLK